MKCLSGLCLIVAASFMLVAPAFAQGNFVDTRRQQHAEQWRQQFTPNRSHANDRQERRKDVRTHRQQRRAVVRDNRQTRRSNRTEARQNFQERRQDYVQQRREHLDNRRTRTDTRRNARQERRQFRTVPEGVPEHMLDREFGVNPIRRGQPVANPRQRQRARGRLTREELNRETQMINPIRRGEPVRDVRELLRRNPSGGRMME